MRCQDTVIVRKIKSALIMGGTTNVTMMLKLFSLVMRMRFCTEMENVTMLKSYDPQKA